MHLSEFTMQLISMLVPLISGVYFFVLLFSLYRREKRISKDQDIKRYTFEYCAKEMKKLNEFTHESEDMSQERADAFFAILNMFDCLAIGVYTGVLDEKVVVMCFGSYMRRFYEDNMLNLFELRKSKNDAGLYANYERFMEELKFRKGRFEDLNGWRVE